jgi:hypothetical protein
MALIFHLPADLTEAHKAAVLTYLYDDRRLNHSRWRLLYQAIDLLDEARVITPRGEHTFRQVYAREIDLRLADLYIEQLLALSDVVDDSPALTATFARQIKPALEQADLVHREATESWLLLAYCVYWWQSFARGYTFEVEIIRDLQAAGVEFHAHDIRQRSERFSPADLVVLGLLGDMKTSTYFLQVEIGDLSNDFYITRLVEAGHPRTLVVFQKSPAWEKIDGDTVDGDITEVMALLPRPVRLRRDDRELVVVEYKVWKRKVLQIQRGEQDG